MGSFNLKHSNWFFFSHKLCSTLSVDKENLNRVLFYMQNIHVLFFFFFFLSISTLYTRRRWLKKKERLVQIQCTTTSREMDTYSAMLYSICTTHPWDLDAEWFTKAKLASTVEQISFCLVNIFPPSNSQIHDVEVNYYVPPKTENNNLLQQK